MIGEILLTSAFYSNLIPIILLINGIKISFYYYVFKLNLLRKCSFKLKLNDELNKIMVNIFKYFMIVFSTSNLLFNYQVLQDGHVAK